MNKPDLGKILKGIRTERKLSQSDFAKLTGTKQPYICSIERGANISVDQFNSLAKKFGVTAKEKVTVTIERKEK